MTAARKFVRADVGFAILVVAAFVLPEWLGYGPWIPALAVAAVLAAGQGLLAGRRPVIPIALAAYLGIYAIAGVHSDPDTFSAVEAGKYFVPPLFALAVAWGAGSSRTRSAIIVISIVAVSIQLPIALVQSVDLIRDVGRDMAWVSADAVVGLLGDNQASTLGQVGIFTGAIVLAAGCVGRLRWQWALPLGALLIFISALTSTRASYAFAPAALGAVAIGFWASTRRSQRMHVSALAPVALALMAVPLLYLGVELLYPGANKTFSTISGLDAELERGDQQLQDPSAGPEAAAEAAETTVLPGRKKQLTLALELSVDEGADTAVLGRGIGATRFKDDTLLAAGAQTDEQVIRPEQETNGVWVARTISETGYLGALAFFGLIAYMLVLWWRNSALLGSPSWDAAIVCALPGVAALTLLSGFYNTILAIQPYATLFWAFLGVAIAIDAGRARRAPTDVSPGRARAPRDAEPREPATATVDP